MRSGRIKMKIRRSENYKSEVSPDLIEIESEFKEDKDSFEDIHDFLTRP